MATTATYPEYLDQIRKQACSRCVEQPIGGPPCAEKGKFCGVETHLEELVHSIHEVQSNLLGPYLFHNRMQICERCALHNSSICPCPMDYLLSLVIEAVETVDRRYDKPNGTVAVKPAETKLYGWEEIYQAYEEGAGSWIGCDWPTKTGATGLDLNGCTAGRANAQAQANEGTAVGDDWQLAAIWLTQIERYAQQAESHAFQAMNAARAGHWRDTLEHAQRAWALEFASGRAVWRPFTPTWQKLRQAAEKAYLSHPAPTQLAVVG